MPQNKKPAPIATAPPTEKLTYTRVSAQLRPGRKTIKKTTARMRITRFTESTLPFLIVNVNRPQLGTFYCARTRDNSNS